MEQKVLRERENRCIQEQSPGCTAACPVHVDARGIAVAVQKNDYQAGAELLYKMVPFPRIISRICDGLCTLQCKRNELDEAIAIHSLEKCCIDHCNELTLKLIPIQLRDKKVAIIGGGLSGLTAAVELGKKGYQIVIFEATERLGGQIWNFPESQLPRERIADDFALLQKLPIKIEFNVTIENERHSELALDSLSAEFDAVYIAIGSCSHAAVQLGLDGDAEGNIITDTVTMITSNPKVFAGGSLLLGSDKISPITSISHGKIVANSIDRLLQKASLTASREHEGAFSTLLYTNLAGVTAQPRMHSAEPSGYTAEEARQEAQRCLACECLECVKVCEYLAHYRGYPKRYVREIYNNLSIVMGMHHANKMINACNLCGLCAQVCPGNLNMGEICREARQVMVKKGKMPPAVHDFALRDMQFSVGEDFALCRHQPGLKSSSTVFFPGCQLSASLPQHVTQIYQFLCEKIAGGVGLMLGCCGVPADWAGQEALYQETLQQIAQQWRALGTPKVITGCPTCYSVFKREFPEMIVETIWTWLEAVGLPAHDATTAKVSLTLAIHDSCTTRHETALQQSIRNIVHTLGHEIVELENSHGFTECCGYGGLMLFANQEIAHKMIDKRINENPHDYLTYCAMCRDNFANQGKRTYHLLDLVFPVAEGQDSAEQRGPGYSERQENRARLKIMLLEELWGEMVENDEDVIALTMNEDVRRLLEDRMILKTDLMKVIEYAENTGNKFKNTEKGTYIAYFKPVSVTYWVEYSRREDEFVVHNAYSHRLEIKK